MDTGIIPVPNIIIGFPEESFESVRTTIECLINLGIHAKPHFATSYPGSEWFYAYKDSIIKQYHGDLEKFICELGDASKITGVISHQFSPMELLGLQQIVAARDLRLLDLSEKHWNANKKADFQPLVQPKESFNMVKKKIQAPLESMRKAL